MWSDRTTPHLTASENAQYHTCDESLYNGMSFLAASARTLNVRSSGGEWQRHDLFQRYAANRFMAEQLGCLACLPALGAFGQSKVPRCSEARSRGCRVLLGKLPLR